MVFISGWKFDTFPVLVGADFSAAGFLEVRTQDELHLINTRTQRWGYPSVSFLTAGGRVDADFSIIERTCRW